LDTFNRWLERFCYRHPNFGVRNLMRYIVILNVLVYILSLVDTQGVFLQYLYFAPHLILSKLQLWRLVTYAFIPTEDFILWFAVAQYFYYFIGTRLEAEWGATKFTIYYFMSVLVTSLLSLAVFALTRSVNLIGIGARYINLSLFLAFATLYPDARVLLFFFIPVKIKWLGYAAALFTLFSVVFYPWPLNLVPLFALIPYFLFFASMLVAQLRRRIGKPPRTPRSSGNVVNFRQAKKRTGAAGGKSVPFTRKCAVCGKTDAEFPDLEFRYCSKCAGYHCFCPEHINAHVHFTE